MMNYPGVIHADAGVLDKLAMCEGRVIDGHAPSVAGRDLNAYAASGIMSDHECIRAEEAAEKLRLGLSIMIREGSQTRNLKALLPLVTPATADRFMFCTDDKDVRDLLGLRCVEEFDRNGGDQVDHALAHGVERGGRHRWLAEWRVGEPAEKDPAGSGIAGERQRRPALGVGPIGQLPAD